MHSDLLSSFFHSIRMQNNTRSRLWLILVLCTIVRLIHYSAISQSAFLDFPFQVNESDMYGYWQWSNTIMAGDWLGMHTYHPHFEWMRSLGDAATWQRWWGDSRVFQQEPFYPYLLALEKSLGFSIAGIILLQLLVGVLQCLATFYLTRLVFRQDAPALIAALIAGLYGPLLFNQGVLLRDWLGPLLGSLTLAAFMVAYEKNRDVFWLWPGMLLGFTLLAYSTMMVFLLTLIPWLVWVNRKSVQQLSGRIGFVLGGMLVGFSPLLIRNVAVGINPFSISNRLPEGIITGIAADSEPLGMKITQSLPLILEKSHGSAVTALIESLKTYQWDGVALLNHLWLKFRALIDPFEIPNNLSFHYGKEISPILRVMPDYGWILPLGLLGMVMVFYLRKVDQKHGLLLSFGVAMLAALLINLVLGRYRLILSAFLFVYAGWAVWQLWCWVAAREKRNLLVASVTLATLFVLQHAVFPVKQVRENIFLTFHPMSYYAASEIYLGKGLVEPAIDEWNRLRMRAEALGNSRIVESAFNQELKLHIKRILDNAKTGQREQVDQNILQLEQLFDRRGAETLRDFSIRDYSLRDYVVGGTYYRLGRLPEARALLQRFVTNFPNLSEARAAYDMLESIRRQSVDPANPFN